MTHVYRVRHRPWPAIPRRPPGNLWHAGELAGRFGAPCRVLARGKMNTVAIEFEDGYRVSCSRNAVRRMG